MPDDVNAPAVGKIPKRWLWVGGAVAAGIVGYAYWKNRSTPVEPISPDSLPEDRVPFTDADVSSGSGASESAGRPLTNAEWSQQATDRMLELGYDSTAVAQALGRYLGRQPLTPDEQTLVRTAIGQIGLPPDGDFPIMSAPPAATPPPSSGGGKPRPRKPTLHWESHHVARQTLIQLATRQSLSKAPAAVSSTKIAIMTRNPRLLGKHNDYVIREGTILWIPVWK